MPNYIHKPVMLAEVLAALKPRPGGRYADGTVGGAGHASAILRTSGPDGWLFGCDRDGAAIEAAQRVLAEFAGRFELRRGTFAELPQWVPEASCDGVLLDLGVSSPQFDVGARGFSLQQEGPLDMRMDQRQERTAADVLAQESAEELARIFWEYGGERDSRRLARAMVQEREQAPFLTTMRLAGFIERLNPRRGQRVHPATRIFQALRIVVNDELRLLREGLAAVWQLVKPEGRLAVITFHSLEDRIVKEFGRTRARDYEVTGEVDRPEFRRPALPQLEWVSRKAIQPRAEEVTENPRARSAQLRVMQKVK